MLPVQVNRLHPILCTRTKFLRRHEDALRTYSGSFSLEISHGLWKAKDLRAKFDWLDADAVKRYRARAAMIMEATERQKPFKHNISVYHGARDKTDVTRDGSWLRKLIDLEVGDILDMDKRFTSASLSFKKGLGFASTARIGKNGKWTRVTKGSKRSYVVVRFDLKANYTKRVQGLYIGGISSHPSELEMILNPHMKWEVHSIDDFTVNEMLKAGVGYQEWTMDGETPDVRIIRVRPV